MQFLVHTRGAIDMTDGSYFNQYVKNALLEGYAKLTILKDNQQSPDYRLDYLNQKGEELLGIRAEDAVGKKAVRF